MVWEMYLLEMGFSASVIILMVIICRVLFMNRLPKKVFLVLWSVALLRLLVPYSFPSVLSIYSLAGNNQFILEKAEDITNWREEKHEEILVTEKDNKHQAGNTINKVLAIVWLAGFITCAAGFIILYIICYKRFCTSLPVDNPYTQEWLKSHKIHRHISIRQSGSVKSPLSYGIIHPVILMPEMADWENVSKMQYILEHEFVHIRRFDALAKLFFIIAACVHWFNPLVWIMYILVNRDIELSCDETVVRNFGESSKAAYALVLISMEEEKSGIVPLGSSFSGNTAEERIKAIMKIKKSSKTAYIMAFVLVAAVVFVFATSAESAGRQQETGNVKKLEKPDVIEENNNDIQEDTIPGTYNTVLGEIAAGIAAKGDYEVLGKIVTFLNKEDLDKIAKYIADKGDYESLQYIISFVGKDTLEEIAEQAKKDGKSDELQYMVPYM
ncbi:MAG: M56 family metallopeptidase [Lachnospiraceae bacterium]|jgi:Antirepressor regulating drug resistance, predicted signal transduction N-terminal membrane component|nr:M56 family metallopeptidase [Lachnospiraceae bacterium]